MTASPQGKQNPTSTPFQRGLMVFNLALGLVMLAVIVLIASIWCSDRVMISVLNNTAAPRMNRLIQNNPDILYDLSQRFDKPALALAVNRLLEKDPKFLSDLAVGLQPETVSLAVNHLLHDRPKFLTDTVGTLDAASIETIIDQVAQDHPEFMLDVVDKIIDLIRKDFVKGI